ncbi:DUF4129 domain-containing protein [Mycobacterium asiaticum]|uniref:Protein-glutamine gamma-glutamyltransferase-like C-terminal domain-containing protein n=1 Tax=Mycobacterium asiaticum TaxID=1790 RepID=A0A1A3MWQ5_MYCAS|nr:DUF4129 domain-containing protein [Mycobacterium asiaticum]OBK14333.1 hypothetical protein A5636_08145 [Mycobacterium asiaticum]
MFDKPTGRVIAVLVLLIVGAAALRGYLPPHHGARPAENGGNNAALVFLIAAIAATVGLLAFSIVARLRDPQSVAPGSSDLSEMLGRGRGERPSWRVVSIAIGVVVAWLAIVFLLSRLWAPPEVNLDAPQQSSNSSPTPAPGGSAPPEQHPRQKDSGDMLGDLLAFVPVLLMLFAGGVVASRRRQRPGAPAATPGDQIATPAAEDASESLVRAAEVGLAEMADLSRRPREAIIACYAAMERELANVPGAVPQEADTPTEVLARAVAHHALRADTAIELVNLFEEARFSPHVMNEGHRETAVRVLELVLDEIAPRSSEAV